METPEVKKTSVRARLESCIATVSMSGAVLARYRWEGETEYSVAEIPDTANVWTDQEVCFAVAIHLGIIRKDEGLILIKREQLKPKPEPATIEMSISACIACGNWNNPPEIPEALHVVLTSGGGREGTVDTPCDFCATTIRTPVVVRFKENGDAS